VCCNEVSILTVAVYSLQQRSVLNFQSFHVYICLLLHRKLDKMAKKKKKDKKKKESSKESSTAGICFSRKRIINNDSFSFRIRRMTSE
jgi:predicted nucleic acid-binding protein